MLVASFYFLLIMEVKSWSWTGGGGGGVMDAEIEKKGSTVMKVTHPTSARKNPEGEIS